MNRRSFTASLAALIAAPALPAVASVAPSTAAPTAASHFATAKLLARAHNTCSPAMLQRLLRVDSAMAHELNRLLIERGVISSASLRGASMAIDPLNTHCVPREALRSSNVAQKIRDLKARLSDASDTLEERADKAVEAPREQDLEGSVTSDGRA